MVRHQISEDLKTFIKEHVRSVFGLEIQGLLHSLIVLPCLLETLA